MYGRDIKLRSVKNPKKKKRHKKWKDWLHKYTLVDNDEKMLPGSKQTLDAFYNDSIKRLEAFCGKSLEGIWYIEEEYEKWT